MENKHLIDIWELRGSEFLAGANSLLQDPDFLIESSITWPVQWIYNQNEFADELGYCNCTVYWFLPRLSDLLKREVTKDERYKICVDRDKIRFNKLVGGRYVDGADVIVNWHNSLYPEDPLFWVLIDNTDPLREKLFKLGITITSTFQGNKKYNADIKDGFLDVLDYGTPTYGHCVGYHELTKVDNYLNKYSFRKVDDFYKLLKNWVEGRTSIALFKESQLTDDGKKILRAMKEKLTNWSRLGEFTSRYEASRWAILKNPGVSESKIWNKKDPGRNVSKYELSLMMQRPAYTNTDRNQEITRRDAILYIMQ